jgi:hypothetical protein
MVNSEDKGASGQFLFLFSPELPSSIEVYRQVCIDNVLFFYFLHSSKVIPVHFADGSSKSLALPLSAAPSDVFEVG